MLPDGNYVDGSWLLTVHIDELDIERKVRVQGDWSVAEVLAELTESLPPPTVLPPAPHEFSLRSGTPKTGWMDHGLWWPARCRWILQSRASLNQYGLQADAILKLVPIYGRLRVRLPDLQIREFVDVSYAEPVFRVTAAICRKLNIRYPEELSLAHQLSYREFKHTKFSTAGFVDRFYQTTKKSTFQRSATISGGQSNGNQKSEEIASNGDVGPSKPLTNGDMKRTSSHASTASEHLFGPPKIRDHRYRSGMWTNSNRSSKYMSLGWDKSLHSPGSMYTLTFELRTLEDPTLAASPLCSVEEALCNQLIHRTSGFMERLRFSTIWLDSSRSLMEQGFDVPQPSSKQLKNGPLPSPPSTASGNSPGDKCNQSGAAVNKECPVLWLRFKYINFYDLSSNYDRVRINQLYEQAKWSVVSEQYDVTDDEAILFAALQAQVEIRTEKELMQEAELSSTMFNDDQPDAGTQVVDSQVTPTSVSAPLSLIPGTGNSRDVSPIGGYLQHFRRTGPSRRKSRPLSTVELESEIDTMLDELALHNLESGQMYTDGRRSRPRGRVHRPVSPVGLRRSPTPPAERAPPMLHDYVKICRPKKFSLKVFRRFYLASDQLRLLVYKREEDFCDRRNPDEVIFLPGCEVQPDLCISTERFNIRLYVPISRANLPLAAAFSIGVNDDLACIEDGEEIGLTNRLRRRASLLSLTSLSHFSNAFGLHPTPQSPTGAPTAKEGVGSGRLCGPSAIALGLVCEIILRFPNANTYADWLAYLRLATAVPNAPVSRDDCDLSTISHPVAKSLTPTNTTDRGTVVPTATSMGAPPPRGSTSAALTATTPLFTYTLFVAERKAIAGLIKLTSPSQTTAAVVVADQTDSSAAPARDQQSAITDLHNWMEKRLIDWLPMRMGLPKSVSKTLDSRRVGGDQVDAPATMPRSNNYHNNHTLGEDRRLIAHGMGAAGIQHQAQIVRHITNVYTQLQSITSIQAKLKYISLWEQLPHNGVAYFPSRVEVSLPLSTLFSTDDTAERQSSRNTVPSWMNRPVGGGLVTLSSSRRVEAVGISPSRVLRCDLHTGEVVASWRLSSIQSWHVNWELGELVLKLATPVPHQQPRGRGEESGSPPTPVSRGAGQVVIRPVGVPVRIVAEFLGGYTFLNLRSPEKNQCMNENMFYKLTTGTAQSFSSVLHS